MLFPLNAMLEGETLRFLDANNDFEALYIHSFDMCDENRGQILIN